MPEKLFNAPRVLTVHSATLPQAGGRDLLVPLRLEGEEGINDLFEYRLILQSPQELGHLGLDPGGANLDLQALLGREISCCIELEGQGAFTAGLPGGAGLPNQGAGQRQINALITGARLLGEDSRQSLYELTLRPWLHLASLTVDCKVFQDQSPVEIIRAILAHYPFASEVRLIESYPVRDYTVQYNETDLQFITRLMHQWGINYHFEHSSGVHRLILSDHNGAFSPLQQGNPQSAYHRLPYLPPGHKTDREYIHAFVPTERLSAASYESREHDYTRPKARLQARASEPGGDAHARQGIYLWRSGQHIGHGQDGVHLAPSDWSQPNAGADNAAHQTEAQGQHLARLRMQALRQGARRASGQAHVRGIAAGHTFTLTDHPQRAANTEYLTLWTQLLIENVSENSSGPAGSNPDVSPKTLSATRRLSGQWRCHVQFEVQPASELLRPGDARQGAPARPRAYGPETALVCGPEPGSSSTDPSNASTEATHSDIYTDALGRIKVQFFWDRQGPRNHTSSCWVRVSQAWAGNQLGAMHIPRVGQEVLIGFIGGDIERPICTGRLHHQEHLPPWQLPAQQALSGMRSRELQASGGHSAAGRSNHLVLDDSQGQIQAQLKSDHQHSSLSLGHITRIEDHTGRKDHRGQGFELRTDGHGAIRARDGLLLTTEARPQAHGHITDLTETSARLTQAQDQHQQLAELARQHQAQDPQDQDSVARTLQAQHQAIEGTAPASEDKKFPELTQPHLVLASPAGIHSTSAASTHLHSGEHHATTSAGHTSLSAGQSLLASARHAIRLFAHKAGMRLVSASADIDIQALQTSIRLLARLQITQSATRITLSAKEEVVIHGGDSYTCWSAGRIESGTTGAHSVHAASHSMQGPANQPPQSLDLPGGQVRADDKLLLVQADGRPLASNGYTLQTTAGQALSGHTSASGETNSLQDELVGGYQITLND